MNYSIYNTISGKIDKVLSVPESMLDLQVDYSTQGVVVGNYDDSKFYILNGNPVPIPVQPSEHYIFDYTAKQWIDPRTLETEWPLVRTKRDRLLQASDWTQLPDVPLATKEAWTAYRQALRDLTDQPDPFNITWPTPPN